MYDILDLCYVEILFEISLIGKIVRKLANTREIRMHHSLYLKFIVRAF